MTSMNSLHAQDASSLQGDWIGELNLGNQTLRIVFHVTMDEEGGLSSTMDSPDQGAKGIRVQSTSFENGTIEMKVASIGGTYKGVLSGGEIDGTWSQGPGSLPLILKRMTEPIAYDRPQEPQRPFPYIEEVVRYTNSQAEIELEGTLTLPGADGKHPAVILISGSGPQDRNEELMGHKPFLVLSDYLTRNGIAVLRYDDRGVGESEGDFAKATSKDFATDVLAAVDFLKQRDDIDSNAIGLVGHSEGGLIAPMVAVESSDVAFIVLLAGPGLPGKDILVLQGAEIGRASGLGNTIVEKSTMVNERLFGVVAQSRDLSTLKDEIQEEINNLREEMSEAEVQMVGLTESRDEQIIERLSSPWMHQFISYDPRPTLEKVTVPVLSLIGEKDLQVPAEPNSKAIGEALEAGGNTDYTIKNLPGLNHLYQTAEKGVPAEYSQITETFSEDAMEIIAAWIKERE